MSADPKKILLVNLWQRKSASGREYLSGFLGKAKLLGFRGEPTADGTETWDLYVCPQEERSGSGQRESRPPTSSSRTGVQRWAPEPTAEKPDSDRPFFSDDISDLGRGE